MMNVEKDFNYYLENYQMECVAIVLLFAAIIMMFMGKAQNYALAMQWHRKSLPILKEQFAYVGIEDNNSALFE
jgi:hypothetical protein